MENKEGALIVEVGRLKDQIADLLDERQDLYAQLDKATPEGFVLVPRKATKHQINKAIYDLNLSGGTDILVDIYKAMIEAQEQK